MHGGVSTKIWDRIHHKKHKNKSSDIFTDPVSITITIHVVHQDKDVSSSEGVSSFSEKNTSAPDHLLALTNGFPDPRSDPHLHHHEISNANLMVRRDNNLFEAKYTSAYHKTLDLTHQNNTILAWKRCRHGYHFTKVTG